MAVEWNAQGDLLRAVTAIYYALATCHFTNLPPWAIVMSFGV